jgi:hypothetical protein
MFVSGELGVVAGALPVKQDNNERVVNNSKKLANNFGLNMNIVNSGFVTTSAHKLYKKGKNHNRKSKKSVLNNGKF